MAAGPKRTGGIVTHVTERFGFIELTNKNIPISQVYFDFTSFEGRRGNDLSKIYPKDTSVSFTFIESKGDHKVKHRAINLAKTRPRDPADPREPQSGNRNPTHFHKTQSQEPFLSEDPAGNRKTKAGHTSGHPGQQGHCSEKSRDPKPRHKQPKRQNSRDVEGTRKQSGGDSGSSYPHDNLFQPAEWKTDSADIPASTGKIFREFLATGLTRLAQEISDQPINNQNQQSEATALPNTEQHKPKGAGNRRNKSKTEHRNPTAKAFSEQNEVEEKKPLQCSDDSSANTQHALAEFVTSEAVPQLSQEPASVKKKKNWRRKDKNPEDPEERIFFDLLGKDLGVAVKTTIKSLGLKSMNNLLLLRLTVGKQPSMRVFKDGESSNHVIDGVKAIELGDLHGLLRHNDAVKTATASHFGVKGTLHSMRSIEQNGKLTGVTLFFQLHEKHDGLGLDIIERKRFTAVVGDLETCPQKYLYSYLRCMSQKMAADKDVLVLDIDGQLSGSDESSHSSLGDVTRISCSSASELPAKITEAMEHLHECVIAIGVDSAATLQALQKLTTKGAHVIVEVNPDMKSEAEALFSA